jgi:hypothetical protein
MDTRLRGYDKKAACNLITTAVPGCKEKALSKHDNQFGFNQVFG